MEYKHDRDTLLSWTANKTASEILEYKQNKNLQSLDGLTALEGITNDTHSECKPAVGCKASKAGASAAVAATTPATVSKQLQMRFEQISTALKLDAMMWLASGMAVGLMLASWLNTPQVAVTG